METTCLYVVKKGNLQYFQATNIGDMKKELDIYIYSRQRMEDILGVQHGIQLGVKR